MATMTAAQFLEDMQDTLQTDEPLTEATSLKDLDEWDSLAMMACMAYFDKNFSVKTTITLLKTCATPADLIRLSNGKVQ